MRDVPSKSTGDIYTAVEFNEGENSELKNYVLNSIQSFSPTDLNQMSKGAANYASKAFHGVDSGTANHYIINAISPMQAPTLVMSEGSRFTFYAANTNTAASDLQAFNDTIARPIQKYDGTGLDPGDIVAGRLVEVTVKGGAYILQSIEDPFLRESLPLFNGIYGLFTNPNAANPTTHIDIAPGTFRDTLSYQAYTLAGTFIKRLDQVWVAGSGNGGRASTVALLPNTWYHLFGIATTSFTVDFGFDTSITATNLLADATGYTAYKRIASVYTDGSSNIVNYIAGSFHGSGCNCADRVHYWITPVTDYNITNPGTSAVVVALPVPPGIYCEMILNAYLSSPTVGCIGWLTNVYHADLAPGAAGAPLGNITADNASANVYTYKIITDTAQQIRYRLSTSDANTNLKLSVMGWVE